MLCSLYDNCKRNSARADRRLVVAAENARLAAVGVHWVLSHSPSHRNIAQWALAPAPTLALAWLDPQRLQYEQSNPQARAVTKEPTLHELRAAEWRAQYTSRGGGGGPVQAQMVQAQMLQTMQQMQAQMQVPAPTHQQMEGTAAEHAPPAYTSHPSAAVQLSPSGYVPHQPPVRPSFCIQCGAPASGAGAFCATCGARLAQ